MCREERALLPNSRTSLGGYSRGPARVLSQQEMRVKALSTPTDPTPSVPSLLATFSQPPPATHSTLQVSESSEPPPTRST